MFDEKLHPGHHSIRLTHRDYRTPGIYFVTICTHQKKCIFGKIVSNTAWPSALGQIVHECWIAIPSHFAHVNLHAFVIMPNHVHGIIEIAGHGAQHTAPLQRIGLGEDRKALVHAGFLAAVVRSFKAAVTRRARVESCYAEEIWQRNYFERVVRDGQEFADTCRYIGENVMKWDGDLENPNTQKSITPGLAGAQHAAPLQRRLLR
jgi:REP element-mobilizing transposase RayT